MEKRFEVTIRLDRLDGGIPSHPDLIGAWLGRAGIQDDDDLAEQIEAGTITEADLEARLQQITTTFLQNDDGEPCLEARCIKAAIKQAAGVMGLYSSVTGIRELLKEGMIVAPKLVPVAKSKEDLCVDTKVMHTIGPKGPRSAFKRTRYVTDPTLTFEVHITNRSEAAAALFGKAAKASRKAVSTLTLDQLKGIIEYAVKYTGVGSNRSQGVGTGELVSIKEI